MGASATLKRRRPSSADPEGENTGAASKRCRLPSADCRERKNTGNTLKRCRGRSSGEWETENVGASSKRRRHCSSANWASLPSPALVLIMDKLLEQVDLVRFDVVCKDWHAFAQEYKDTTKRCGKSLPMLMIRPLLRYTKGKGSSCPQGKRELYRVSDGKVYKNVLLSVPWSKRCCGSDQGWLVSVDELDKLRLSVTLMNPFRKAVAPVLLPPLDNPNAGPSGSFYFYGWFPKVILHGEPAMNNRDSKYAVVAIYDRISDHSDHRLAFFEEGQKSWTYIDNQENYLSDAIIYKNQVYGVGQSGAIWSFNFNSKPPKAKVLTANHSRFAIKGYLVESTKGDLLHVRRFLKEEAKEFWTEGFHVYKLVFKGKDESAVEQVEVKSIGGEAIFVGDNYSMSVLASDHPGLQPNCIYYTDDLEEVAGEPQYFYYNGPSDMGIFNLEDETIARHYSPSPRSINNPAALWIVPPSNEFC
ncbi:unnamed protein product [Malus baccata var. baccata]